MTTIDQLLNDEQRLQLAERQAAVVARALAQVMRSHPRREPPACSGP